MNEYRYGYARVSTESQKDSLSIQVARLEQAGCTVIREEIASGTNRERPELETLVTFLRDGDTLVVQRLDRLARSLRDLSNISHELQQKGVGLITLDQPIDTTTPAGKMCFGMLATFAEFENDLRRERQREGIERAKAAGVYKGRPPSIDREAIEQLKTEGLGPTAIAEKLGISRSSVYRIGESFSISPDIFTSRQFVTNN